MVVLQYVILTQNYGNIILNINILYHIIIALNRIRNGRLQKNRKSFNISLQVCCYFSLADRFIHYRRSMFNNMYYLNVKRRWSLKTIVQQEINNNKAYYISTINVRLIFFNNIIERQHFEQSAIDVERFSQATIHK